MEEKNYPTWYELKQDLQKQVGRNILTKEWLSIKPREPLPWDTSSLHSSLLKLSDRGTGYRSGEYLLTGKL